MAYPRWDPGKLSRAGNKIEAFSRLLRIEHTLFSLPFAYAGAILSGYPFTAFDALWMATAVLGLRTAAMAYNNIADLDIDRLNPRTASRPLVVGAVSLREAWSLVLGGSLLYFISAAMLNIYALLLSPIVLAVAITYPHAKRIHPLPHIHLGLSLGAVVFGGAVAASGDEAAGLGEVLVSVPWLLVAAVILWVAGFDTIYSIMDADFDQKYGLRSIPAFLGPRLSRLAAVAMHTITSILLILLARVYGFGILGWTAVIVSIILMAVEHVLAWRGMLREAFNTNLAIALLLSLGIIADYTI